MRLAVALMKARNFLPQDFARFHPGGSLGRRLLHRVREEMHAHDLPFVGSNEGADDVLAAVTRGGLGIALVSDDRESAVGIITDGDLRRALQTHKAGFFERSAAELMTPNPITIAADSNMQTAIELMAEHKITLLVVVDGERIVGVVQK